MKNIYTSLCLAALILSFGCKKDSAQPCNYNGPIERTVENKNGKIYKLLDTWVIDLTVNGSVIRCAPCNLPDGLKVENTSIELDANFHPIPPNVRLIGQPMEITHIY